MSPEHGHERWEALLMRRVDGCLHDPAERRAFDQHLSTCESCRTELRDFGAIKQTTDAMTARVLADLTIEPPRPRPAARAALRFSFVLLGLGATLLLGFAAWAFVTDASVPLVVKLGASLAGLGGLGLFGYALVVRSRASRRDPYQEIDL